MAQRRLASVTVCAVFSEKNKDSPKSTVSAGRKPSHNQHYEKLPVFCRRYFRLRGHAGRVVSVRRRWAMLHNATAVMRLCATAQTTMLAGASLGPWCAACGEKRKGKEKAVDFQRATN